MCGLNVVRVDGVTSQFWAEKQKKMAEYVMQVQHSEPILQTILNPKKTETVKANRAYMRYFVKQIFRLPQGDFDFSGNMWSLAFFLSFLWVCMCHIPTNTPTYTHTRAYM